MKRPIIIDCGGEAGDLIALEMVHNSPEALTLLGITTTGSAGLEGENVFAGCSRPFSPSLGSENQEPLSPSKRMHGVDFLIQTLLQTSQKITIVALGPLTNIALAIVREPFVRQMIEEIIIVGGAVDEGDITPAAQRHFYTDPFAAAIVLSSKVPLTLLTRELMFDASLEAPCAIAYLLTSSLFQGPRSVFVSVECGEGLLRGRTCIDWWKKLDLPLQVTVFESMKIPEVLGLIHQKTGGKPWSTSKNPFCFPICHPFVGGDPGDNEGIYGVDMDSRLRGNDKFEPLIIDCDPGLDDAVALLMAMALPEQIDLLGVTTAVGNTALRHVQNNARKICELAGRLDIKVFAGCPRPFMSWTHYDEAQEEMDPNFSYVKSLHGDTGMGGTPLPNPTHPLEEKDAVNFIIDTLREASHPLTIIATGALTNLGAAFVMAPDIVSKINKIIIMGGVRGIGNITPAAEHNFYVDPLAASIVFKAGVKIVLSTLDLTRKVLAHPGWLKEVRALGSTAAQAIADIIESRPKGHYEPGMSESVLHDPTTVGYLLKPDIFSGREAYVDICTTPGPNLGRSTVDWEGAFSGKPPQTFVLTDLDVPAFYALMTSLLARYPLKDAA